MKVPFEYFPTDVIDRYNLVLFHSLSACALTPRDAHNFVSAPTILVLNTSASPTLTTSLMHFTQLSKYLIHEHHHNMA